MPIYRLLQRSAFEPEHVAVMVDAFEDVCLTLGLAQRDDPLRDLVAQAIIECAQTGVRDRIKLIDCAHQAIGR